MITLDIGQVIGVLVVFAMMMEDESKSDRPLSSQIIAAVKGTIATYAVLAGIAWLIGRLM